MWNIAEPGKEKGHGRYIRSLMQRDEDKYIRVAKHLKSLKALMGEDGYLATVNGIANVDFNNGLIRFPCAVKQSQESMVIDKIYQKMERKTMGDGYYTINPTSLRFEERFIEDINRYRPQMPKPCFENGQIAFCCEIDEKVIDDLLGVAKHADRNGKPVMFAPTRAFCETLSVTHTFNFGKTIGFKGENLFHVLMHLRAAMCKTWRVFKTRAKYKDKGRQYVFVNSFSRDPWSDCVVLFADV